MYPELASYIKQRRDQNASWEEIEKELLSVGWPKEHIETAFKEAGRTHEAPPPALAQEKETAPIRENAPFSPVSPAAAPETPTQTPASDPQSPTSAFASSSSLGGGEGAGMLGLFDILRTGTRLYKSRLGVLTGIGALLFLGIFIFAFLEVMLVVWSHAAPAGSVAPKVIPLILSLLLIVVLLWFWGWVYAAFFSTALSPTSPKLFHAFEETRARAWGMLWVFILFTSSVWGAAASYGFLVGLPLAGFAYFSGYPPASQIIFIVAALIAGFIAFSTVYFWTFFAPWAFVAEENVRGMRALTFAREIVRGRFWRIVGRLIGILFILGVIFFAVTAFIYFLALFLGFPASIANLILQFISSLFFLPFFATVMGVFYREARRTASSINPRTRTRRAFITYAILGIAAGPFIFFAVILASLNVARQKDVEASTIS